MGKLNYVATAHKPTKVTHSCVGNFTSLEYTNLVIAKCNRLEIHKITPDGIELIRDVPINGRIVSLELFHSRDEPLDLLFILTERYKTCVLQWDVHSCELITRSASMDITVPKCKEPYHDQICTVDPDCRVIGLFLCGNSCEVVPLNDIGQLEKPIKFWLGGLLVKDIKFLYGCEVPTVAVLCQDTEGASHAKTYEVSQVSTVPVTRKKPVTWSRDDLDCGAGLLIAVPTPLCGVLIIGEKRIVYCRENTYTDLPKRHSTTKAYGKVDAFRFLLGDGEGQLHLLVVGHENQRVTKLTSECLGETSVASTISYLGNSLLFVGSSYGDSQLIKVDLDSQGSGIQVLKTFVNLGPIQDLCLIDLEKHGQTQVVSCSGGSKDGSLRIVSKGINKQASLKLAGIVGLWSLKSSVDEALHTFLVVSFIGETLIFAMNSEDELEDIEIEGFLSQVQTLFCHDAVYNQLVQVTSNSVRLVSSTTRKLLCNWDAPAGLTVNIATANAGQVLLATEDRHLFYFEVGDGTLTEVKRTQLDHTASCLNINPIGTNPNFSELALVGKWTDDRLEIRKLPDLTLFTKTQLGGNVIPRSVLLCAFEGISYLLCGLGDGNLIIFRLDEITGDIVHTKRVSLGTQPIALHAFSRKNSVYVFATSDRSTTIYSSQKKLFINELNLGVVTHMCQLNLSAYPDRVAIATIDELIVGNIDPIRTIPLGESPRCICHQFQTNTYGVCSGENQFVRLSTSYCGFCNVKNSENQFVRLLEPESFQSLSAYRLNPSESGEYIVSCLFTDDDNEYFCVGTNSPSPSPECSTKGRLLVFSVENNQLQLIFEKDTARCINTLHAFQGRLLASYGGRIQLYKWTGRELQLECEGQTMVKIKHVVTDEKVIFTVDDLDLINFFVYKNGELEKQAAFSDIKFQDITAVQIVDGSVYLTCDSFFNLQTLMKNAEDERLDDIVGQYHLGDCVNRFCRLADSKIVFGTSAGMIGVIAPLSKAQFLLVENLQNCMRERLDPLGGLLHKDWRSFHCVWDINPKSLEAFSFIDGDFIESFLEINREIKEKISDDLGMPLQELCKIVEDLKVSLP